MPGRRTGGPTCPPPPIPAVCGRGQVCVASTGRRGCPRLGLLSPAPIPPRTSRVRAGSGLPSVTGRAGYLSRSPRFTARMRKQVPSGLHPRQHTNRSVCRSSFPVPAGLGLNGEQGIWRQAMPYRRRSVQTTHPSAMNVGTEAWATGHAIAWRRPPSSPSSGSGGLGPEQERRIWRPSCLRCGPPGSHFPIPAAWDLNESEGSGGKDGGTGANRPPFDMKAGVEAWATCPPPMWSARFSLSGPTGGV